MYYDSKPSCIAAVGDGSYLFRWDIQEERIVVDEGVEVTQYSCCESTLSGVPEYGKCIVSVLRQDYSVDDELALVNKYNAYKQGIIDDASIEGEYAEYLSYVDKVKSMVDAALSSVHAGSLSAPIPYERGMSLEVGKYYSQYDVTYRCVASVSGVDSDLYQMVDYVEAVE